MIDIILTIVLGSLAGVAAFLSCVAIWRVNPADFILKTVAENYNKSNMHPDDSAKADLEEGAVMQLSVNIEQQELALTKEGTTVKGTYVNIERNRDGVQTCNKIFLN